MCAEQPALEQGRDSMHSRKKFGGVFLSTAEDRDLTFVAFLVEPSITLPTIGMNGASWRDAIRDERMEALRRGVWNHPEPDAPDAQTVDLRGDHN